MKTLYIRYFNIDAAGKMLLLIGYAFFFLYTILTGSVSMYVHPRVIPFMIFASVVMIIIAVLLGKILFKPQHKKVHSGLQIFFAIPLIMAFAWPATSFDSNAGAAFDVQLANSLNNNTTAGESDSNNSTDSGNTGADIIINDKAEAVPLIQNGILVMNSSNFYKCIIEVYNDMAQYEGLPVEVVGFVFKDSEDFADDEFVPARLMMVCCAADMQPVGFLCRYDHAAELPADSWVKVTGTIEETKLAGETIPYIAATSVEKTTKPDDDYVYPY